MVEHQVEGLVVFAQWPLVAAEARAAEFGEQAQALVVAAAQGQALFGVLLVGVADQRVDQPGGDDYSGSPFVQIFSLIGSGTAANILNFVVLTAALSVYNSGVYCNSRMLYGLAAQGDAPKVLMSVDRRGVPVLSILVSALITFLCVIVNYVLPHKALELLMSLVVGPAPTGRFPPPFPGAALGCRRRPHGCCAPAPTHATPRSGAGATARHRGG